MTSFVEFADAGYHWATVGAGWMLLVVIAGVVMILGMAGLEKVWPKVPDIVTVLLVALGLVAVYGGIIVFLALGILGLLVQPGMDMEHLSLVAEACGYSDVRHLEGENIFSAVDPQGDQVTIQVTEVRDEQYAVTEIPR